MPQIPLVNRRGDAVGFAIVDDCDLEPLSRLAWRLSSQGYAYRQEKVGGSKTIVLMHRVIAAPVGRQVVDHVNRDRVDNRRANLRCCTTAQNIANQAGHRDRSARFKGIRNTHRPTSDRQWRARISVNGKTTWLPGRYATDVEAAMAYDAAAVALYGEFASLNFPIARAAS